MLFIDQLEELFTRGFGESRIQAFLKRIVAATAIKSSRLRVLATVRNEFLGHLAEIPVTRELLNAGAGYHLGTVSPRDLQDMIEKPAEVTGYRFESDLVQRILADSRPFAAVTTGFRYRPKILNTVCRSWMHGDIQAR